MSQDSMDLQTEGEIAQKVYEILEENKISDAEIAIFIPFFIAYLAIKDNYNLVDAIEYLEKTILNKAINILKIYFK
ncbi:MAG: hypothetical protein QXL06_06700 [Nitrososphaerota archaeon]